jgi:hypothetical protein
MCAATEPAAREAYYSDKPASRKKTIITKKKVVTQMKEMLPRYMEYKGQKAENSGMSREDRNILKMGRPSMTMIPVANVELPEPPQEAKRVVVGKTIRVRKPSATSSKNRENQAMMSEPDLLEEVVRFLRYAEQSKVPIDYLMSKFDEKEFELGKKTPKNIKSAAKIFGDGNDEIMKQIRAIKSSARDIFSQTNLTAIDIRGKPKSYYTTEDEMIQYGYTFNNETKKHDIDTRVMQKEVNSTISNLDAMYYDIMGKFGISRDRATQLKSGHSLY